MLKQLYQFLCRFIFVGTFNADCYPVTLDKAEGKQCHDACQFDLDILFFQDDFPFVRRDLIHNDTGRPNMNSRLVLYHCRTLNHNGKYIKVTNILPEQRVVFRILVILSPRHTREDSQSVDATRIPDTIYYKEKVRYYYSMKVRSKLLLLNVVFLVGFVCAGFVLTLSIRTLMSEYHIGLEGTSLIGELHELSNLTKEILLTEDLHDTLPEVTAQVRRVDDRIETYLTASVKTAPRETKDVLEIYDVTKRQLESVLAKVEEIEKRYPDYLPGLVEAYSYYQVFTIDRAAKEVLQLSTYLSETLTVRLKALVDEVSRQNARLATSAIRFSIVVSAAILFILTFFSLLTIRGLDRRIGEFRRQLLRFETGDISSDVVLSGRDEFSAIAEAMNQFIILLRELLHDVRKIIFAHHESQKETIGIIETSDRVREEAVAGVNTAEEEAEQLHTMVSAGESELKDLRKGFSDLSVKLSTQNTSISESSAAVEEMNASIASATRIARERQEASGRLAVSTQKGHAMLEATGKMVSDTVSDMEKIKDIVTIINDISEKTNLLSMNAAIQAAHAGEAGKGFAVLAGEIRRLADSTGENAHMIQEAIETAAKRSVEMNQGAVNTLQLFRDILAESDRAQSSMSEIVGAMEEILSGSGEITRAILSIRDTSVEMDERSAEMDNASLKVSKTIGQVGGHASTMENATTDLGKAVLSMGERVTQLGEAGRSAAAVIASLAEKIGRFRLED